MKNEVDRTRTTNLLLTIIVVFIVGLVLKLVQHVITALLISLLLAYLMDTFIVYMRRLRFPMWLASALTIVIFLGAFIGIGMVLYSNVRQFQVEFPKYEAKLFAMLQILQTRLQAALSTEIPLNPLSSLKNLPVVSLAFKTAQSIIAFGFDFGIIFFFSVLIVLGKHQFIRNIVRIFPRSRGSRVPITLSHIDKNLRRYLGVKAFVSLLAATLEMIILLLFGVKFAVIWGLMTFLLNFIPSIGAILATLLPTLFALAQFSDPLMSLWVFIAIASVHMTVGNILDPTLMGETLNLSLLVVFVSLFFWGWLWGALGILLAVPMTATIKIILQNVPSTSRYATFLEKTRGHRSLFGGGKNSEKPIDDDDPDSDPFSDPDDGVGATSHC
jgi:predicted PurR-regulated permease PerM